MSSELEKTYSTVLTDAYRTIIVQHKQSIEKVEKLIKKNAFYAPPIFSLVLDEARTVEDIPRAMIYIKEELSDLTQLQNTFRNALKEAKNLKEEIDIAEEHFESNRVLAEKLASLTKTKSLIRHFFDIANL